MGLYRGHLHINDPAKAGLKIPYSFAIKLDDPLTDSLRRAFWTADYPASFITFNAENRKLEFLFDKTDSATPSSTGISSIFRLSGDVRAGINFQLRDDMMSGFEVAFYLSTSSLPGPWDGDITGFFITGLTNHIRLTCTSIFMQTDSRDIPYFAGQVTSGRLVISRRADTVGFTFSPADSRWSPTVMNSLTFPADSTVFVHVRMKVDDQLRYRHCLWSDFEVTKGTLNF
jgi:hypothetical protein